MRYILRDYLAATLFGGGIFEDSLSLSRIVFFFWWHFQGSRLALPHLLTIRPPCHHAPFIHNKAYSQCHIRSSRVLDQDISMLTL